MRQTVSSPWRNRASFWRARMAAESGSNSGARRRAPSASVPAEIASPWPVSQSGDPVQGPKTRMALVQEPRPHAGPVGRVREQARHRRRRDFRRRGRAIAASAPARARDHPRVRLDGYLDQFRRVGAVRHIRCPAIGADALVRRGVVNFRASFETRPGRATMADGAGLLAARTVRARPLPALALAPEPRLGMHRPTRAKLRKLRLELPDTGSPGLDLHAQRDDRAPLARIHARRRQQSLQPPDLGAQRQRLPRRAAYLPHLGPRRRQLVPTDQELPLPGPCLGAPVNLAAAQFLRAPPLALEQQSPVRLAAFRGRRGGPASPPGRAAKIHVPEPRTKPPAKLVPETTCAQKITHVEARYQHFANRKPPNRIGQIYLTKYHGTTERLRSMERDESHNILKLGIKCQIPLCSFTRPNTFREMVYSTSMPAPRSHGVSDFGTIIHLSRRSCTTKAIFWVVSGDSLAADLRLVVMRLTRSGMRARCSVRPVKLDEMVLDGRGPYRLPVEGKS